MMSGAAAMESNVLDRLPYWPLETVAVLGGGPSFMLDQLEHIKGKCPVIAVNRAFEIAPWCDLLHAHDSSFWLKKCPEARAHPGPKTTCQEEIEGLIFLPLADRARGAPFTDPAKPIYRGRTSGDQAMQIAAVRGASRVVLLGFDCRANGWWHDGYGAPQRTDYEGRVLSMHRDVLAPAIRKLGVEVINCSPGSALEGVYPMADIRDVI